MALSLFSLLFYLMIYFSRQDVSNDFEINIEVYSLVSSESFLK